MVIYSSAFYCLTTSQYQKIIIYHGSWRDGWDHVEGSRLMEMPISDHKQARCKFPGGQLLRTLQRLTGFSGC